MGMLDRALGVPPMIEAAVTDLAGLLQKRQLRELLRVIAEFEAEFPQVTAAFVACHSPKNIPLRGYLFWLFNHSRVVPALENGGCNRLILLGVDPTAGTSACMIGYGLEPFVPPSVLSTALGAAATAFAAGDFASGMGAVLGQIAPVLTRVAEEAPQAFGLQGEPLEVIEQLEDKPFAAALKY